MDDLGLEDINLDESLAQPDQMNSPKVPDSARVSRLCSIVNIRVFINHNLQQQWRIQPVGLTVFPKFENSKIVWNYRELITRMYRIDIRASHYKINPPLLITCTDWTDRRQTDEFF